MNPIIEELYGVFKNSTDDMLAGREEYMIFVPGDVVELLIGAEWVACVPVMVDKEGQCLHCPVDDDYDNGTILIDADGCTAYSVKSDLINGYRVRRAVKKR